ncbi:Glycoside hydrolase [Mycena indigotica]|uniref:glucan 1,3-beta-glucosidase n=1 Tax=Mycena indigotica TaxID=2126181 RepID=A0A8H6SAW1_9AGAR|nr:Glycoside hydrolase [Mycena indigotica]KAF7295346.1 Glycoside hydrolase [Mycena indigotica]
MSQPPPVVHPGTGGVDYAPLPLTHDSDQPNRLYNAPPSPGADNSSFHLPLDNHGGPYTDDIALSGMPMGAAQPRFLGRALYDDGGANMRNSIASSQHTLRSDTASSYTAADSVYNLRGATTQGYSDSGAYHDEPGFFVHGDQPRLRNEKRAAYAKPRSRRKPILIGLAVIAVLAIILGVVLAFLLKRKSSDEGSKDSGSKSGDSNTSSDGSSTNNANKIAIAVSGSDGSTILADDGSSFVYSNSFGGTWQWDINDPFNNSARAQSWTPALNQPFRFGVDPIRGVNLGGWLVTEPFIVPGLYQTIQSRPTSSGITIIDEYTLLQAMALDTANGGVSQLEDHYKTFITEKDFMEIAAAGLNFIRIPIGFWAIEVKDGEGFLPKTSWTYFLKAIQWARKYGLRINLDLHTLPGSQNGWNHSGRLGNFNVMFGPMGIANAQRSLDYIRILSEFISQPEYSDVVVMFGVTNEPQGNSIGIDALKRYYYQAYLSVRTASGTGQGKGPMVSFHDGFIGLDQYAGFLPNADRASMDTHPYLCFSDQNDSPISSYANTPCNNWGGLINGTMATFGFIVAGEFSNAVTDCGLYVNGVGQGIRYEGNYITPPPRGGTWPRLGDCETDWTNWEQWSSGTKQSYKTFAKASMDALQNWFFWTWKIGNSTAGRVESPHWSYSLGLEHGWMPTDPREAVGQCGNAAPFQGTLSAWQTGGAGAGQIPSAYIQASLQWPPPSISFPGGNSPGNSLPTYVPNGPLITLPTPTFTPVTVSGHVVSATASVKLAAWANPADTIGMMVPAQGCSYFDPWGPSNVNPPSPLCTGGGGGGAAPAPAAAIITPPSLPTTKTVAMI